MKRYLLLVVLLISGSAFADGCEYVAGTWRIDRFDDSLQAQIESEIVFSDNGDLRADRRVDDGTESRYYEDWASWSCANGVITIEFRDQMYGLERGTVVYFELQEINNSYFAYREIRDGEAGSISTTVRQATRVSERSFIYCC